MLPTSLNIASYNACSLTPLKQQFCLDLMRDHKIDILMVQEVRWSDTSSTATISPALFHHLPYNSHHNSEDSSGTKKGTSRAPRGLAVLIGDDLLSSKKHIKIYHQDETAQSTVTIRIGAVYITNVYLPPCTKKKEWMATFRAIPDFSFGHTTTIHVLLGDWNTRLGEKTGDTRENKRAVHFNRFVQSRSLAVVPFALPTHTFSDSQSHTSTLDFVLVSADHLGACSPVTVLNQSNGGSDHFPIMIKVMTSATIAASIANNEEQLAQNPRRIATHLLEKREKVRKEYSNDVNNLLRDVLVRHQQTWSSVRSNTQMNISTAQYLLDTLLSSTLSTLLSSAEKHCKARKRFDPSKSAFTSDNVLVDLREQRVHPFEAVEDVCFGARSEGFNTLPVEPDK